MSGRRQASRGSENRRSTPRNLPTILSRKRKSDEDDPMQPDIQSFFNVLPKSGISANTSSSSSNTSINMQTVIVRPSSRVPLGTISLGGDNNQQDKSLDQSSSQSIVDQTTPLKRGSDSGGGSRRKQSVKRRESWSQFRAFISEPVRKKARGDAPLPDFKWADRQLMWDLMVKRESGVYARLGAAAMLDRHTAVQPKMRAILLDWLIEVCEVYKLHRETFYLAVDFLDRYLGKADSVPKNRLQLIGVTCLFIGAKLEEIYPPKLAEFAYVTDGACTEQEILEMELEILKKLNWSLSPMTPNSWMRTFSQIIHGPKNDTSVSFTIPAYNGLPFSRLMQLLDLCMLDFGCLDFAYSELAAAALFHLEGERVALSVSGYTWPQLSRCVRWMSAFVFAIRERSPVQVKSFHNVLIEDSHHLQNHVVDVALLERATARLAALADASLRESPDVSAQRMITGLENTPQEEEGDLMYPPSAAGSLLPAGVAPAAVSPHLGLLSPPLDGDFW